MQMGWVGASYTVVRAMTSHWFEAQVKRSPFAHSLHVDTTKT